MFNEITEPTNPDSGFNADTVISPNGTMESVSLIESKIYTFNTSYLFLHVQTIRTRTDPTLQTEKSNNATEEKKR